MPNKTSGETCTRIDTDACRLSVEKAESRLGKSKAAQKRIGIVLCCILACLIALYAASFFPRNEKNIRASFINKKYASSLDEIEITGGGKRTALYKKNGVWYGFAKSDIFPAESEKVKNLTQNLTRVRKSSIILNSNTIDKINKNEAVLSIFFKNNLKSSIKIDDLNLSFDGTKVCVRIEDGKTKYAFYEIENDFFSFMRSDADFWLDPYIIPQNTEEGAIRPSDIQALRLTISSRGEGKILRVGQELFSEKVSQLSSLRHGGMGDFEDEKSSRHTVFSLSVETGRGFAFTMHAEDARDGKVPLFFDSFENTLTGSRFDYRYRVYVSTWTLEKILALF